MTYKRYRPQPDIRSPRGWGVCAWCQLPYFHSELRREMQWRGNRLVWTGHLVCWKHLDTPQDQDRTLKLRPDPVPIRNPRPDILPTTSYLLDAAGVPADLAFGLRKLSPTYSGPALTVTNAADEQLDIGFVGEDLNMAQALSFANGRPLQATYLFDQGGSGLPYALSFNDPSAPTPMLVDGAMRNGRLPGLYFPERDDGYPLFFNAQVVDPPWTLSAVAMRTQAPAFMHGGIMVDDNDTGLFFSDVDQSVWLVDDLDGAAATASVPAADNVLHSIVGTSAGGIGTLNVDSGSATAAGFTSHFADFTLILVGQGVHPSHSLFFGFINEMLFFPGGLSAAQTQAVMANQKAYWGTP